jgi:hypothetical protein
VLELDDGAGWISDVGPVRRDRHLDEFILNRVLPGQMPGTDVFRPRITVVDRFVSPVVSLDRTAFRDDGPAAGGALAPTPFEWPALRTVDDRESQHLDRSP